jgi:hypothetical protein
MDAGAGIHFQSSLPITALFTKLGDHLLKPADFAQPLSKAPVIDNFSALDEKSKSFNSCSVPTWPNMNGLDFKAIHQQPLVSLQEKLLMKIAKHLADRIKFGPGLVLAVVLAMSLPGCVGYVDGGYGGYDDGGYYGGGPDVYLFDGGGYGRGRDVHAYSQRGAASRGSAHVGGSRGGGSHGGGGHGGHR